MLATRLHDKWAAKEHIGHLVDLRPLVDRRLIEFLNQAEVLSAADIENRAAEIADHQSVPIAEIVGRLTAGREALVRRLEVLSEEHAGIVALRPRLQKPMRLVDWYILC